MKSEPNLNALGTIRFVDLICHFWQQYINTVLLPLASSSVTTRREMVLFNNQTVTRLETGTNNVLQKMTDCVFSLLALCIIPTEIHHSHDQLAFFATIKTKTQ